MKLKVSLEIATLVYLAEYAITRRKFAYLPAILAHSFRSTPQNVNPQVTLVIISAVPTVKIILIYSNYNLTI